MRAPGTSRRHGSSRAFNARLLAVLIAVVTVLTVAVALPSVALADPPPSSCPTTGPCLVLDDSRGHKSDKVVAHYWYVSPFGECNGYTDAQLTWDGEILVPTKALDTSDPKYCTVDFAAVRPAESRSLRWSYRDGQCVLRRPAVGRVRPARQHRHPDLHDRPHPDARRQAQVRARRHRSERDVRPELEPVRVRRGAVLLGRASPRWPRPDRPVVLQRDLLAGERSEAECRRQPHHQCPGLQSHLPAVLGRLGGLHGPRHPHADADAPADPDAHTDAATDPDADRHPDGEPRTLGVTIGLRGAIARALAVGRAEPVGIGRSAGGDEPARAHARRRGPGRPSRPGRRAAGTRTCPRS